VKKTGLLNHHLSDVVARMGHTQRLVVADAGLPIPPGVERIDLAIIPGLPSVVDLLHAIATELEVEQIIVAEELANQGNSLADDASRAFGGAPVTSVPHEEFKRLTEGAVAVVRTGECSPYANIMLISGVTF
jgi:D-ribose pyranase